MPEDERTTQLKEEIRARLRGVCKNLPEASFEELVQKIADQARKSLIPDRPDSGRKKQRRQEMEALWPAVHFD
jgi:hypothetical protein